MSFDIGRHLNSCFYIIYIIQIDMNYCNLYKYEFGVHTRMQIFRRKRTRSKNSSHKIVILKIFKISKFSHFRAVNSKVDTEKIK